MNLDLQELIHINGMAADAAKLQAELDAKKAELAAMEEKLAAMEKELSQWKERAQMYESNRTAMMIENMCLKFILLRMDRVREFFTRMDPLNQSLLLTFIIKALPENTPNDVFESVRNMLEITSPQTAPVVQHADQVIGLNNGEINHTKSEEHDK